MADGRPAGYGPFLELYLRTKAEGGGLASPASFRGRLDERARTRCLVLVHGFNNSDVEAAQSYHGYRNRQVELTGLAREAIEKFFADAFWPGDADWGRWDWADALAYPAAVKVAPLAAKELVALLRSMPNLERVSFIGHSLGCRVVMEALALLVERPVPVIDAVCLMAAAVPAEMLEPRGRFFPLMERLRANATRVYVLHSTRDVVLQRAFPPGQRAAREASNRALGRVGPSPVMPGFGGNLTDSVAAGAGHGDYWGHKRTAASDEATSKSGRFLGLAPVAREVGEARGLAAPMTRIESRAIGIERHI